MEAHVDAEEQRLRDTHERNVRWKAWGPYLSERQWGTVREDYSRTGNAWDYFSHDQARSRAYRWGEDGLAGISDDRQILCFALALWNGHDPILKERLVGLTNSEGNHGEDVNDIIISTIRRPIAGCAISTNICIRRIPMLSGLRECPPQGNRPARARIRTDRYRSLRRRSLFRYKYFHGDIGA